MSLSSLVVRSSSLLLALPCLSPALLAQDSTPNRVIVEGSMIADDLAFPAQRSYAATGTDTLLSRLPQSVQVVPRSVLDAQDAQSITDATRNVSGVTGLTNREINNAGFRVRGFEADVYLDGVRQYSTGRTLDSLIGIERVEVVKGPGSLLFSGGLGAPVGGSVYLISKTAQPGAFGEIGLRGGSFGTVQFFADVNQPLDRQGRLLFRLSGDAERAEDSIDRVHSRRWSVFPTLTWRIAPSTELTVRGRYSYREQTDYSGLPAVGTLLPASFSTPRDRFIGTAGQPDTTASTWTVEATLRHRFNEVFTLQLTAAYADTNFNQYSVFTFPSLPAPGTSSFPLAAGYLPLDVKSWTISPSLVAKFATGPVRHTLSLGLDYDRTTEKGDLFFSFGLPNFDVLNPVYAPFSFAGFNTFQRDNRYETLGFYLQEQASVGERLHLQAGVRYTRLETQDRDLIGGVAIDFRRSRFTFRGGAVYEFAEGCSVFGGYSEGFQAPLGVSSRARLEPVTSQQAEAGLRWIVKERVTASLAFFEVRKQNVATPDPANPLLSVQTGEQRVRGVELDVSWQLTPSFALLANYAYLDGEITRDNALPVGARLPRVPLHSGRLYGRYEWKQGPAKGLGFGLGVTASSKRAGDQTNSFFTPATYSVDAQISYTRGPWRGLVSIENLTNRRTYEPNVFFFGNAAPTRPIAAFATLAYSWGSAPVSAPSTPTAK